MRHLCGRQKPRRLDAADLFLRRKRLIAVGRNTGALDHNKRVIEGVVAGVAPGGKLIERTRERIPIFSLDRLFNGSDRDTDRFLNGIAADLLVDIIEAVFELFNFIVGQPPIGRPAGEPKLEMAHLLKGHDVADAAVEGAVLRLRPIMMTTLVATLGLLPAALSRGIGSDSQRPFAIVIVGGLLVAMLMNIFLLPTLYVWIAGKGDVLPEPEADFDEQE